MNLSADTLSGRVDAALAACPHVRPGDVRCRMDESQVVLVGKVESFFAKQMAQEAVRRLDGVTQIDNQLEVHWI